MNLSLSKFGFVLILITLVQFTIRGGVLASGSRVQSSDQAYATLLYGDEFLLGVRVLGKSIRDTKTTKDLVVLVSDGVSTYAKKLLKADGWIVQPISLLENPNQIRPTRFWGVYTKLKIFNMTTYKKVLYLDADTVVVNSIEDLFKCGKFCANLKHSEKLNSGVLVVEPSETVFRDMMSKVKTLQSYTGGDQGFLNSYYTGFANAHVFEPELPEEVLNSRPVPEMQRLSTLYNADVGLYMLANKWMVDEKDLHVIHYTLGPLKPWDWWTSWLLKPVDVWQAVRVRVEESLPGTGGGRNPNTDLLVKFIFLFPLFALMLCYYRSFLQIRFLCSHIRYLYYNFRSWHLLTYSAASSHAFNSSQQAKVPAFLGGISVFICFMAAVVSLAISLAIVPRQVMPWTGLLLMYEWTFTIFFILFGGYLGLVYQWGKQRANQAGSISSHFEAFDYDSGKSHQRQVSSHDIAVWYYWLGMAFLAVAAPSLPCIFGITALFLRLGLMVMGGLVLTSFMTYASEHLATRSFLRGLEDRDSSTMRNNIFFS